MRWMIGFLVCLPAVASAGPLPVKGATASSHYTEEGNYEPKRAIDGKQGTAWVEGEPGSGLGSWIQLDLGEAQTVHGLRVWGGDWYNREYWGRANRPKELEVRFSDDSTESITLTDEMVPQRFSFSPRTTTTVKLRIKSTYSGSTWLDTGISEIQVLGPAGAGRAEPKAIKASSEAPPDGDGSYVAANAADDITDSMWCEGSDGDGTGEWIEFTFDAPKKVSRLRLLNGIGTSLPLWMKANRAKAATLTFSDGTKHALEIKPNFRPVELSFPVVSTTSVRITFTEVLKGTEYNDLCVSEAWFLE